MSSNSVGQSPLEAFVSGGDGAEPGLAQSESLGVFLLTRSLALGGAQRQLVYLARGLLQRGHRVTVGTFYPGGPLAVELEQAGVTVIALHKGGRWDTIPFLLSLRRAINDVRPDVLYSFTGSANIFAALVRPFLSGTKFVWSIRASDMDLLRYDWAHRVGYQLECRLSRAADLIISNSHAGMEFAVAHGFPRQRVAVIANGIDTIRFRPDPSLRKTQRAKWGISEREFVAGILARLDPMKGHADFLLAAARIAQRRDDVRFVCIGDGREEAGLKQLSDELSISDRVQFAGPTNDPVAALNGLDLFCSASVWGEGFSNSIAEAMACGLRCVVTDVGDSALIVGRCGTVVPRSNPELLADAVVEQLDMLDNAEFSQGRTRIVEEFSIDAMVDGTLALLRQTADAARAG